MSGISRLPAALPPDLARPGASFTRASLSRGAQAAREFEAHLIGPLLESLEKSFSTIPGGDSMPGADNYSFLGTEALAQALADRGGFGIADMILRDLAAHDGNQ